MRWLGNAQSKVWLPLIGGGERRKGSPLGVSPGGVWRMCPGCPTIFPQKGKENPGRQPYET